jgi:hypothetical protein
MVNLFRFISFWFLHLIFREYRKIIIALFSICHELQVFYWVMPTYAVRADSSATRVHRKKKLNKKDINGETSRRRMLKAKDTI